MGEYLPRSGPAIPGRSRSGAPAEVVERAVAGAQLPADGAGDGGGDKDLGQLSGGDHLGTEGQMGGQGSGEGATRAVGVDTGDANGAQQRHAVTVEQHVDG